MPDIFARFSAADSGERLLNAFLRPATGEGGVMRILGRSGLVPVHDLGGDVRAVCVHKGGLFAVAGGHLWEIGDEATDRGALPEGAARMASGSTQIAITVGGNYYVYNSTAETLEAETPSTLTNVVDVAHLAGYFILFGSNAGRDDGYVFSALDDATDFDALDFAFAESDEDAFVGAIVDRTTVWVFGTRTVEKLYIGTSGPTPDVASMIPRGCHSAATIAKADGRVFWVGADRVAYAGAGAGSAVISERWIDDILKEATILRAFTFSDRGSLFYAIVLEGRPALVYDISASAALEAPVWHERSHGLDESAWRATCAINHNGTEWLGMTTGELCTLDAGTYSDAGDVFEMLAVSQPLPADEEFVLSWLSIKTGGGGEDIGRTPRVMLQVARKPDVWSREKWRDLPKLGQHGKEITWRGLGWSDFFQARIRITDPVNRDLEAASYG